MNIPPGDLDLLAIGEALIDMISIEEADSLRSACCFERFQGGSPLNLAANMARLGKKSAVVARTGRDAFGSFIKDELQKIGVSTQYFSTDSQAHTSIVFVTRTQGTPDFSLLRDADYRVESRDLPGDAICRAKVVHATIWPFSREPFRTTAIHAFHQAHELGKLVSLDPNYSSLVWPDRQEARSVLSRVLADVTLLKPSLDDARRLWGEATTPEDYIARFHELGARVVVLTMGKEGGLLSDGEQLTHIPASPVDVADATGAGDAFWAGFLTALLEGCALLRCVYFAREVAALKLATVGPLPARIDKQAIYARIGVIE